MPTCTEGHITTSEDYCDVCGAQISSPAERPGPRSAARGEVCPECGIPLGGRFCEACGRDSALPAPPAEPAGIARWTAVVAADRGYYERTLARGGPDTVEFPEFFPERRITLRRNTALIGRRNRKQGVEPEIDLGIHPIDRGVSAQHAVLRLNESGLTVTDLGSTNGTSLNDRDDLLVYGEETPLRDGDRIHVGAWTTITVLQGGRT
jgi:FHA domain-containing protein